MADLSTYTPIYIRTTGNDATGNGSLAAPFATAQKGFQTAYLATGNHVLDLGEGSFGGVNLANASATEWPSRIAVRGVSVSATNLGGIFASYNENLNYGDDPNVSVAEITITGNNTANLGNITTSYPQLVGGGVYLTDSTAGNITVDTFCYGNIGLSNSTAGSLSAQSSSCYVNVSVLNSTVGNVTTGDSGGDLHLSGTFLVGSISTNAIRVNGSLFTGYLSGVYWVSPSGSYETYATTLNQYGTGAWNSPWGSRYYINGQETDLPTDPSLQGTGSWNNKYYVNGVETSLNSDGDGWWNNTWYYTGFATPLDSNGNGYWEGNSAVGAAYFIGGSMTALDSSGTGWWNEKYWIAGAETTLPESGTGWWNNVWYHMGTPTTLDSNGTGWWGGSEADSVAPAYWLGGSMTALDSSGTGVWNDKCYVNGQESGTPDCNGVCGGSAVVDDCGVCGGNNASKDCDGTCGGSAVADCAGVCNGSAVVDDCGVCGGNNASKDCAGTCGGSNFWNDCDYTPCGSNFWNDCYGIQCGPNNYNDGCGTPCGNCHVQEFGWHGACNCFGEGFYINYQLTSLPESGTGWWNDKFWIGGAETPLDSNGAGWWNNKYWVGGVETTLPESGTGWWNNKYYVGGQIFTGLAYINKSEPFPNDVGYFYFSNGEPATGEYEGKTYFNGRYVRNLLPCINGFGKLGTDLIRWKEGHFSDALKVGDSTVLTSSSAQPLLDGKANTSHTHTISNVTGLQTALDGKAATSHTHTISNVTGLQTALDGKQPSGSYATLVSGVVPASQLPSYVDDVLEFQDLQSFPATGEQGKIYVATESNKTYRWSGSAYIEISPSPGSTDAVTEGSTNLYFTAARAISALASTLANYATQAWVTAQDYATTANVSAAISALVTGVSSVAGKTGVVTLVKGDVGLGNVDNTSDANKPISTAVQTALDGKAATSHTHTISNVTGLQTALDERAKSPQIDRFVGSGTWTKPLGAKQVVIECVAGGGGGGAGLKVGAATAVSGGSGGGSGGYTRVVVDAADLPATDIYTVTVGSGGAGGISGGTAAQSGGFARVSGSTLGIFANAAGGSGGSVGVSGGNSAAGFGGAPSGNTGGAGNITGSGGNGSGQQFSASSGGAGGGCSATTPFGGGVGGAAHFTSSGAATSGAASTTSNGGNGGIGVIRPIPSLLINGGGGGGGGATTANGFSGGAGGSAVGYGGGGGGGGSCSATNGTGGNGGSGAPGIIVITTYF